MWLILLRTLIIYCLIILAMRLMGKKQLGELQPSELVSTILISNLASISIESPELPMAGSIIPVFIIVSAEILVSAICVRSRRAAKLVSGAPRVIIQNGVLDQRTLYELRFTVDDLLEALRGKDIFELSEVDFAMVETNGTISVRKRFDADTPKNSDLFLPPPKATQPSLPIVIDGHIHSINLDFLQLTESFIEKTAKRESCPQKEMFLLLCNDAHETHLIRKQPAKSSAPRKVDKQNGRGAKHAQKGG